MSPRVVLDFQRHRLNGSGERDVVTGRASGGLAHQTGQFRIRKRLEVALERCTTGVGEIDGERILHFLQVRSREVCQLGQIVACNSQRALIHVGLGDDPLRFGHVYIPTDHIVSSIVVEPHIIVVVESVAGRELIFAFGQCKTCRGSRHCFVWSGAFASLCRDVSFGERIAERPFCALLHHLPHLGEVGIGLWHGAQFV